MADIDRLTESRGRDYGHPLDQFNTTQEMYKIWKTRRSEGIEIESELENTLQHIVYMIIDKIVRSAQNPYKQDNYDDIQGYASLWESATKEFYKRITKEREVVKYDEGSTD